MGETSLKASQLVDIHTFVISFTLIYVHNIPFYPNPIGASLIHPFMSSGDSIQITRGDHLVMYTTRYPVVVGQIITDEEIGKLADETEKR